MGTGCWEREIGGARRRRRRVREVLRRQRMLIRLADFETSAALLSIDECFSPAAVRPDFRSPSSPPYLIAAPLIW
eukprot:2489870-Pleurochrysis_carterae.AAC.1